MQSPIFLTPATHPEFFKWPNNLAPKVKNLYAIGNIDLLNSHPKIAIVGSRIISDYGKQILNLIIPTFVRQNITIVSGGAFGVDVFAQETALKYNGKIITVLGSGILNPTPKTNIPFFQQVIHQGLLLSEEKGNTPAQKYSFVKRNRIIAAISDLILIVEARQKSGSLITADYALQQNKPICCFPGRAFDYLAKGGNQLIKEGAFMVETAEEIISLLPSQI